MSVAIVLLFIVSVIIVYSKVPNKGTRTYDSNFFGKSPMKFSTLNNFFSCEEKEIIFDFSKKKVGESVRLFGTLE